MEIYSYHYGAAPGEGIGIRAQSRELKELENQPLSSFLRELSSLHALESSEHRGKKLCYVLERDGYTIFGLSYPESPKESGYNRTAPCGLQYVIQTDVWNTYADYAGEIVRTAAFRKPETPFPEPAAVFPQDKNRPASGVRPDVMARIVDGLAQAALSQENDVLLIALPRGLASEYETARSAIGEALDYLPPALRKNIRFLTGLPVPEGETKGLTGYENAIRLNANAVFCPHQYYNDLKVYRSFIGVDMEQPDGEAGAFAKYILQFSNPETRKQELQKISARLLKAAGKQPYEELNQAAEDRAKEKAAEEAEAQRRKAQAQASSKKKGGKKQDAGSGVPDVRTDRRSSYLTDSPGEKNVIENARKTRGNRNSGTGHSGADSGRPASSGRYGISAANEEPRQQHQSNNEFESEKDKKFANIVIIFAVIAVTVIVGLVLWFYLSKGNTVILPEATSVPAFTETPEPKTQPTLSPGSEAASTPEPAAVPPAEEEQVQDLPASPEPTPAPTASAAETEVEPIPQENVIVPTPEPTVQAYAGEPPLSDPDTISDSVLHNCYAITNGIDLKLRPDRSTAHDFLAKIAKGSHVWAVRTEKNNQGEDWTEAYYNGKHGYIMTKFLDFLSPEESRTYDQAQKTPVPANMYGQ